MASRTTSTSILLVIAQFGSIIVLLIGGTWALPLWAWIAFAAGLVLFFWAMASLGTGNFTILPEPRAGNAISQRGIYRWLRHPMYTSVILCGSALAFGAPSKMRWIAWAVCVAALLVKVIHEERAITAVHADYPDRMKGTWRLVPWIW
jgi:protein-S-isoprenylcysteine O-methyltransferase Ste14